MDTILFVLAREIDPVPILGLSLAFISVRWGLEVAVTATLILLWLWQWSEALP